MKQQMYRHGDVGLFPVDELPKGAVLEKSASGEFGEDIILAWGEVTGHAHRIAAPQRVSSWDVAGQRYVVVEEDADAATKAALRAAVEAAGAILNHEDHGPMVLEPGVYRVQIQREYTPGGDIRQVLD